MRSSNVIGVPESSEAFEARCAVLFRNVVNDPHLKGVATSGANQQGIDLIGMRDGDPHQPLSVQCKLKKRHDRLSVTEAKSDIDRALLIRPQLTEIYVATTAPDDIELDRLVISTAQEQAKLGRAVRIAIWGWDELQRRIRQYPDAQRAFDPEYSSSTGELLNLGREAVNIGRASAAEQAAAKTGHQLMAADIQRILAIVQSEDGGSGAALDKVFDQQIDTFRDLLNTGRPNTAADMLLDLEGRLPDTASPAVRSRIRANLGFARMRQDRDAEAAAFLRDAHDLNPTDRKARANLALASVLEGDLAAAMAACRVLLDEDASDALAASYAYQAAALDSACENPDGFVASAMRAENNVAINRLNMLRRRDDPAWLEAAEQLLADHPESGVAQRFAAEAMLDDAFRTRAFDLPPGQGRDRRARIERAIELLQTHWDEVRRFENAGQDVWAGVGVNLVTAYRSLRRGEDARRVADQLLAIAPDLPDARIAAAHLDIIDDQLARALERVSRLPESGARTMIMIAAMSARSDWPGVIAFATPERQSGVRDADRRHYDTLLARARIEIRADDPATILRELVATWPGDAHVIAGAAQIAREHVPDSAKQLSAELQSCLGENTPFSARLMAAEIALDLDDHDGVIAALDGHVEADAVSPPVVWLAWAYANAPVTPRTRAFFDGLPTDVIDHPRIARLAGAAANARGDIATARRHLERALDADPHDLRARMLLHGVHMRADRREAADELVRATDETTAAGGAVDRMRLAMMLRQAGEDMRAFELAFATASTNRNDERVVQSYPSIFFVSQRIPAEVRMTGPAQVGDWFAMKEIGGGKEMSGLISAGTVPEVVSYPPDHPMARHMLGKSAKDTVEIAQGIGAPRRYKVKEVKHRYVWLLHDIMHSHATRFPESTSMGSMTMRKGDVTPVLDMARQHQQHGLDICDMYKELSLPLEALAAINRVSVLQVSELIPQYGGEIRTCRGEHGEREAALRECARARGQGIVLDTLTAWRAHHLGLLPAMRNFFGVIAIPQTTLDDLLEMRGREELHLGQKYMTVGYEGDQAVRQVHMPEEIQDRVDMVTQTIQSLRDNCDVVPVEGTDDPELAQLIHREVVESMLDPQLVARQTGRLLISDDMHFRKMTFGQGVTAGAWLQTAARAMLTGGAIDRQTYAVTVARLASLRHGHVWLDGDVLLDMLRHEQGQVLIEAASAYIGGPRAEILSHCHAVADFMNRAWSERLPSWRVGAAASVLIARLISGRDDYWQALQLLSGVIARTTGPDARPDLSQDHLRGWIRGHFLSKPDTPTAPGRKPGARRSRKNSLPPAS